MNLVEALVDLSHHAWIQKIRQGGSWQCFFSHQHISWRSVREAIEEIK